MTLELSNFNSEEERLISEEKLFSLIQDHVHPEQVVRRARIVSHQLAKDATEAQAEQIQFFLNFLKSFTNE